MQAIFKYHPRAESVSQCSDICFLAKSLSYNGTLHLFLFGVFTIRKIEQVHTRVSQILHQQKSNLIITLVAPTRIIFRKLNKFLKRTPIFPKHRRLVFGMPDEVYLFFLQDCGTFVFRCGVHACTSGFCILPRRDFLLVYKPYPCFSFHFRGHISKGCEVFDAS